MKRLSLAIALLLLATTFTTADIPGRPRQAMHEVIPPHAGGEARAFCSIIYYNVCSYWIWTWSGWSPDDIAGIVFDLPEDCGWTPGSGSTQNTHFWWYWRYTNPGYLGNFITYELYEVDDYGCLGVSPTGALQGTDPLERWNYFPGLGTVETDRAALVARWETGTIPRLVTDNNYKNLNSPVACPDYEVGPAHTFFFGTSQTTYCPPLEFADSWGPIDCLMEAGWDNPTIRTESASWSSIKKFFR